MLNQVESTLFQRCVSTGTALEWQDCQQQIFWVSIYLGFKNTHAGTIFAEFDLQIPILPTKFRVHWPFGLGGVVPKKVYKMTAIWKCDRNDFSCFFTYKSHWYFRLSFESVSLSFQEEKFKIDFQDGGHAGFSDRIDLRYFWYADRPYCQILSQLVQAVGDVI